MHALPSAVNNRDVWCLCYSPFSMVWCLTNEIIVIVKLMSFAYTVLGIIDNALAMVATSQLTTVVQGQKILLLHPTRSRSSGEAGMAANNSWKSVLHAFAAGSRSTCIIRGRLAILRPMRRSSKGKIVCALVCRIVGERGSVNLSKTGR